jgi:ArsR family transcriptional regulator, arsenate/arsenite/antimonite-responsive transcriptional repressor
MMAIQAFRASIPGMSEHSQVLEMESMFMALADRTRLRLLNLMADGEVCVNFFTEALGESQPKVSRHLAYLRNAGLVDTRRHGKWIYYSIKRPGNDASESVINATLVALADDSELHSDRARLSRLNMGRTRSAIEPSTSTGTSEYYELLRPARPVHNDLDEFLL